MEQERRYIVDRVGEETSLEECALCYSASCFSCVSDHCIALEKLSDGGCAFYKDYELLFTGWADKKMICSPCRAYQVNIIRHQRNSSWKNVLTPESLSRVRDIGHADGRRSAFNVFDPVFLQLIQQRVKITSIREWLEE